MIILEQEYLDNDSKRTSSDILNGALAAGEFFAETGTAVY